MSTISVNNLTFGYEGAPGDVFEGVSFAFDTDWKLGLIGRNGRGKTTLLRLLLGDHEYRGSISFSAQFLYFPFDVENESLTPSEIMKSVCSVGEFWELCREANLLGVDAEALLRPFLSLSGGEKTKILLSILFIKSEHEGGFLLLDEPTNHLDAQGKSDILRYLSGKRGFLLVSHDRTLLDAVCDHIVSIGRAEIEVVAGNFSSWYEHKTARDESEQQRNREFKKDIRKMATAARRTSDWSDKVEGTKYKKANSDIHSNIDRGFIGAKSAKLMKRAKALESRKDDAISQKESLLKNIDRPGDLKLSPLAHHAATLIDIQDMQIAYEDSNPLFSNLSFSITTGERVCLSGGNGSGKSSLLRLMAGESVPHAGHIKTASNLIISYVPQDTSALSGNMKEYAESCGVDVTLFLAILRNLGVERTQFDLPIEQGSEGQKKKVLLARSLSEKAHIYIWDEPLNYIDPISRIQIEDLLIEYKPTMLFVEHDPAFAEKISTRTISLA